jgi:hypothetical protein
VLRPKRAKQRRRYDLLLPPIGKASPLWSYKVENPDTPGYGFGEPSSISVGNVDGDSKLEVVFTVWFGGDSQTTLFVLDAETGTLKYSTIIPYISCSSVALANLDPLKDNALEMVVTSSSKLGQQTTVLKVVDGALRNLSGWPQSYGNGNIDPVVGDLENDGEYEILVGNQLWHASGVNAPGPGNYWPSHSTGAFVQLCNDGCGVKAILTGDAPLGGVWGVMDKSGTIESYQLTTGETETLAGPDGMNLQQGVPIIADVDGDGCPDIVCPSELRFRNGQISKLYSSATSQFPLLIVNPDKSLFSSALVDDVDGDGKTDLLICASGKFYFWNLGQTYSPDAASRPWRMFQHDLAHTGTLTKISHGPCQLSIAHKDNSMVISWTGCGVLQQADRVGGPLTDWTDVPGPTSLYATSPYTVPPPLPITKYYRLQCN